MTLLEQALEVEWNTVGEGLPDRQGQGDLDGFSHCTFGLARELFRQGQGVFG